MSRPLCCVSTRLAGGIIAALKDTNHGGGGGGGGGGGLAHINEENSLD